MYRFKIKLCGSVKNKMEMLFGYEKAGEFGGIKQIENKLYM